VERRNQKPAKPTNTTIAAMIHACIFKFDFDFAFDLDFCLLFAIGFFLSRSALQKSKSLAQGCQV
jgi:hypothetical protein